MKQIGEIIHIEIKYKVDIYELKKLFIGILLFD
jgi:hypothetical protein